MILFKHLFKLFGLYQEGANLSKITNTVVLETSRTSESPRDDFLNDSWTEVALSESRLRLESAGLKPLSSGVVVFNTALADGQRLMSTLSLRFGVALNDLEEGFLLMEALSDDDAESLLKDFMVRVLDGDVTAEPVLFAD